MERRSRVGVGNATLRESFTDGKGEAGHRWCRLTRKASTERTTRARAADERTPDWGMTSAAKIAKVAQSDEATRQHDQAAAISAQSKQHLSEIRAATPPVFPGYSALFLPAFSWHPSPSRRRSAEAAIPRYRLWRLSILRSLLRLGGSAPSAPIFTSLDGILRQISLYFRAIPA